VLKKGVSTSFLFIVIIMSVFLFALIPPIIIGLFPNFIELPFLLRKSILLLVRFPFVFPIASLAYEILKLSAKFSKTTFGKIVSRPGIWLQYITTKEPDNKQVEVAIKSLELVLQKEKIAKPI